MEEAIAAKYWRPARKRLWTGCLRESEKSELQYQRQLTEGKSQLKGTKSAEYEKTKTNYNFIKKVTL